MQIFITADRVSGRRRLTLDQKLPHAAPKRGARRWLPGPDANAIQLPDAVGRLCLHRKRINISTVLAGQRLGIKEVDEGIWLVSLMRHDLGYFDLERKTLQPLDNPFGTRLSPMS